MRVDGTALPEASVAADSAELYEEAALATLDGYMGWLEKGTFEMSLKRDLNEENVCYLS